jgi:hypothetical protein
VSRLSTFLTAFVLLSCARETSRRPAVNSEFFAVDRAYEHVVLSPQECEKAGPIFNCRPSVVFCADGEVEMAVTDIRGGGTYSVNGDRIAMNGMSGDTPRSFEYRIEADGQRLIDDVTGWAWNLRQLYPGECR